jgi:hypothetical protein
VPVEQPGKAARVEVVGLVPLPHLAGLAQLGVHHRRGPEAHSRRGVGLHPLELRRELAGQPHVVGVGQGDALGAQCLEAGRAGVRGASAAFAAHEPAAAAVALLQADRSRRAVVHYDHLVGRRVLIQHRVQRLRQIWRFAVRGQEHPDAGHARAACS